MASNDKDSQAELKPMLQSVFNYKNLLLASLIAGIYFFIWALLSHSVAGTVLGVIELLLALTAVLIEKDKIHLKRGNRIIPRMLAILSLVMVIPYVAYFDAAKPYQETERITWSELTLKEKIPAISLSWGSVTKNTETELSLSLINISQDVYTDYVSDCQVLGYTVTSDSDDTKTEAYDESGYQLSLSYSKDEKTLDIDLTAPYELSEMEFPDGLCTEQIPLPSFTKGYIAQDDKNGITVYVDTKSKGAYSSYMKKCIEHGFTESSEKTDTYYHAYNEAGYELTLRYFSYNVICIAVAIPEYEVTLNVEYKYTSIISRGRLNFYVDDELIDEVNNVDTSFSASLTLGIHTFRFASAKSEDVYTEMEIEITEPQTINLLVEKHFGGTLEMAQVFPEEEEETGENTALDDAEYDSYTTAFSCNQSQGTLYLLFDTEANAAISFSTADNTIQKGTYVGDFATGVVITWDDMSADKTSVFTHRETQAVASYKDTDSKAYTYTVTDIQEALAQIKAAE